MGFTNCHQNTADTADFVSPTLKTTWIYTESTRLRRTFWTHGESRRLKRLKSCQENSKYSALTEAFFVRECQRAGVRYTRTHYKTVEMCSRPTGRLNALIRQARFRNPGCCGSMVHTLSIWVTTNTPNEKKKKKPEPQAQEQ